MTEKDTGGPAFPSRYVHTDGRIFYEEGMSQRDYFATHCGVGGSVNQITGERLAGRPMPDIDEDTEGHLAFWYEVEAKLRYMRADAMVRESAK